MVTGSRKQWDTISYRPISEWNIGKISEFNERINFSEKKLLDAIDKDVIV